VGSRYLEVNSVSVVNGMLNVEVKSDTEPRWRQGVGQIFCYQTLCREVEDHDRVTGTVFIELQL